MDSKTLLPNLFRTHLTFKLPVLLFLAGLLFNPMSSKAQCQVDAVCDNVPAQWDHNDWSKEMRSIARIIIDTTGLDTSCSGVLLNNTLNNNELYVLTAFHCIDNSPRDGILSQSEIDRVADFKYYFHYYKEDCNLPAIKEPIVLNENYDAELVASWYTTDFALIKLHANFDFCDAEMENHLYWAGWTRSTTPFSSATDQVVGLHHPTMGVGGVPMKVSVYNDDPVIFGAVNYRWEVPDLWDLGDIEYGSSGSPLFTDEHLVCGQLETGSAYAPCSTGTNPTDYSVYPRFDHSWLGGGTPQTQLKHWLCPDCNGVNDPMSIEGTEYIGGSAVGGINFSCGDISYTVRKRPLPACCWEIEVELSGGACINGFKVAMSNGTSDVYEKIVTDFDTLNGKLLFEYCISGDDNFFTQIKVTPLGTNNSVICGTTTYPLDPDLRCDECQCNNSAYSVKYRFSYAATTPGWEGWCCYVPVVKKLNADACDVYSIYTEFSGPAGVSDVVPLMPNVGDSVELPEICLPPFTNPELVITNLYSQFDDPGDGDDPMCSISDYAQPCCSCPGNYLLDIKTINSTPDECCFTVTATWQGSNEDCKPKSVWLYDDQGVYTGNSSSHIDGINFVSFQNICINRDDFPKTYQLRFFEEFLIDPQNPPAEMCHLDAEFTPCDFNCCSLYDLQVVERYTPTEKCADLIINQSHQVEGCEVMSVSATDQLGNVFFLPWIPGTNMVNLCCLPYPTIAPLNLWKITLHGANGPLIDPFSGDTCSQAIFFTCGTPFGGKIAGADDNTNTSEGAAARAMSKDESGAGLPYFHTYPNPAGDEVYVEFTLNRSAYVELEIRDQKGALLKSLQSKITEAGLNSLKFDTSQWAAGTYFIVLKKDNSSQTIPLIIRR